MAPLPLTAVMVWHDRVHRSAAVVAKSVDDLVLAKVENPMLQSLDAVNEWVIVFNVEMPQELYESVCLPLTTDFCYRITPGLVMKMIYLQGGWQVLLDIATPYLQHIVAISPNYEISLVPDDEDDQKPDFLQRRSTS